MCLSASVGACARPVSGPSVKNARKGIFWPRSLLKNSGTDFLWGMVLSIPFSVILILVRDPSVEAASLSQAAQSVHSCQHIGLRICGR